METILILSISVLSVVSFVHIADISMRFEAMITYMVALK